MNNQTQELPQQLTHALQKIILRLESHLSKDALPGQAKDLLINAVIQILNAASGNQSEGHMAHVVDQLVATVEGLDQAALDLVAGAEAQVAEFEEQIKQTANDNESTLAIIDAEFNRREQARCKVAQIQEELENRKDALKEQLETINNLIAHQVVDNPAKSKQEAEKIKHEMETLQLSIDGLVSAIVKNDYEVHQLLQYKLAIKRVSAGLPEGLIGRKLF